ncbi:MAG: succinylglutamate desuccinylase/aspartoacylase family protein [Chloroflexota bacterium]|nr:succinylglutamate desuccinylase/aspartoacylase family protein [Chloroflexota bacterium]
MPERIPIDDFDLRTLPTGRKARFLLDAFPTLGGTVRIPALVVAGAHPGPVLLAVAAVHGNEYEGQEAVRAVFERLDPDALSGIYCTIPVCNIFAYEARSRATPPHLDGLNLARVFPGNPHGSPTQRLAHHLMQVVTHNLGADDLFVDFHSGSEEMNYLPLIGYRDIASAGRMASEEAARHFGGAMLWLVDDGVGMFNAETSRCGIPTVGTETTGQAGCRPEDVALFTEGLLNLLRFKGMLPGGPPPRDDAIPCRGVSVVATETGFLRPAHRLGDTVRAGDPLGEMISVFGDRLEALHAPNDGTIWMQRTCPATRAGDVACILGVPLNP